MNYLNLESMLAIFRVSMSSWSLWLARVNTLSLQCLNCFLVLRMWGTRRVRPPSSYSHLETRKVMMMMMMMMMMMTMMLMMLMMMMMTMMLK